MRTLLTSYLDQCVARGEEPAVAQQRGLRVERWTYAQLTATARQCARELEARGVGKGDRAILWGANGAEWMAAFFGCLLRGAVVVPLDEQSAPDFAQRVQQQVRAKLWWCGDEQRGHCPIDVPCLPLDDLSAVVAGHSAAPYPPPNLSADDLAEIIFTSGTTAEPKGVCLTHRNLLANLNPLEAEIDKYRRWERPFHPLRCLNLLPLSHVFGQMMGIFVPRLLGGVVFHQAALSPAEITATIKRERISVVAAVPRQLETLRAHVERELAERGRLARFQRTFAAAAGKHFLRRWWLFRAVHRRFGWKCWAFVSGGATLDEGVEEFWQRLGFAVVQGYGMTETAALVSVNHPFKPGRGSIGKTLPGQEVRLAANGEILVRGANVSAGYWRGDGVVSAQSDAGWLHTGDVGALDAAGNLYFKGREKDVIVTAAGLNIYPEDLEAALQRQPEVRASCVLGVEGANGPEPLAVLLLRTENADAAAVVQRANEALNPAQRMRRWFVWREADFPRTPTHKVRKPLVREIVEAALTGNASAPAADSLRALIATVGGAAAAGVDSSAVLPLDSLGRVALLSALGERYQVELDEAAITSATTVGDLERQIKLSRAGAADDAAAVAYPYPHWALKPPTMWLRRLVYYALLLPVTRLLCWVSVYGREHLREVRGPVLFVSNHVSMVDQGLILSALPGRFRRRLATAMDGERLRAYRRPPATLSWWRRGLRRLIYVLLAALCNVFPLPRQSGFRRSFAYAGEALERGYSLLVFPEGRVTEDGRMNQFMPGIGLLAEQLEVEIVPIRIEGLFELKRRRKYFAWPGAVTVTFGPALKFARDAEAAAITPVLEAQVRRLSRAHDAAARGD